MVASFIVYIFVNMFENIIHYNIGKVSHEKTKQIEFPETEDLLKITLVMFIFAGLQGALTFVFNNYMPEL